VPTAPDAPEGATASVPAIPIPVDQEQIHRHLDSVVRDTVEATLNALLAIQDAIARVEAARVLLAKVCQHLGGQRLGGQRRADPGHEEGAA
jgi:hypothetical protein